MSNSCTKLKYLPLFFILTRVLSNVTRFFLCLKCSVIDDLYEISILVSNEVNILVSIMKSIYFFLQWSQYIYQYSCKNIISEVLESKEVPCEGSHRKPRKLRHIDTENVWKIYRILLVYIQNCYQPTFL